MKMLRLILVCVLLCSVECAKILQVFPAISYSHFVLGERLGKELARRGHEVTMISPFPQKTPINNYRDISIQNILEIFKDVRQNLIEWNKMGPLEHAKLLVEMGKSITQTTFENDNVQKLLNSNESFDLVIVAHFVNDAHVGFAHHFKAPFIIMFSNVPGIIINYLVANPAPSSYVPNMIVGFPPRMNFWQRIQNLVANVISDATRQLLHMPVQRKLFKKYIKSDLELDDVLYNSSLMFTNSHVSVNNPVPVVPSIVEIGGFHVKPPKKLPDDLQKFLDEAKTGVVLFSMGSNLQSKDLKPEIRNAILRTFEKFEQKFLWKFETDLPEVPKNVKVVKWVPQQDVLAHDHVKAFISHGGLLSTIEAVYHGVPIIGIPVFGDQQNNINSAINSGYAVSVVLTELNEAKLTWALTEILNNPKYRENVRKRSKIMNDRPLKPLDEAVFWVEHVIRHGASHLRNPGLDLKWYQRNMLDIFIFLSLVTIVVCIIFYVVIKKLFGARTKKQTVVKKNKKNK